MNKRKWTWLSVGLGAVLGLVAYIFFSWPEPPVGEVALAREKLRLLDEEDLAHFGGRTYLDAFAFYDSAMNGWSRENERFILFRNFDSVQLWAIQAATLADEALIRARSGKQDARIAAEKALDQAKTQAALFSSFYQNLPLSQQQRKKLAQSKVLVQESTGALKKKDYPLCKQKADSASLLVGEVLESTRNMLENYFRNFPQWKSDVNYALDQSARQKKSIILVDKFARQCFVYKNGKLQKQFDIELSSNWVGDKSHQGDKSTPEGKYKVVSKKSGGATRYYKAFLLNYPNEEDVKRFRSKQKSGQIPRSAKIGNLIEIHGHGGKGVDWTNGCVALKDTDMDELFALCGVGTEVIIVGSVRSLEQLMEKK